MIKTKKITFGTKGFTDIVNLNPDIEEFVAETGMDEGVVSVFVRGSTGAVTVIEYEPNLVKDFRNVMERIVPSDIPYEHTKTWNDDNGHAHVRASIIGCSETIPVSGGRPVLGTWQQVIVIDFDTCSRNREVILTCIW
ncbi:MAG: secondary thiamine-phosphate synthase enzyme YjbQ [Elusimicrobiota bacterium]